MTKPQKECFGILDRVFPVGPEGLREIPPGCFVCADSRPCLQSALGTREGLKLRREALDRSPAAGILGRVKRWSERKEISRLSEQAGSRKT